MLGWNFLDSVVGFEELDELLNFRGACRMRCILDDFGGIRRIRRIRRSSDGDRGAAAGPAGQHWVVASGDSGTEATSVASNGLRIQVEHRIEVVS